MSISEEDSTALHYRQLLEEHGQSHRTLNWGSREGQHLRFEVLAEIGNLNEKRILDVGCGLGDLAGWLAENSIQADYTGLDFTPELIKKARKVYPELRFIQGSVLDESLLVGENFDFVFASGIFVTYNKDSTNWVRVAVARMWSLAKEGVAFNALSTWATNQELDEYHADPSEILAICRELSPWVVLRHDYHPRDLTAYMLRNPRR
jgi:SAM-dependent methyltransferase